MNHWNSMDEFERSQRIRQANAERAANWYQAVNRSLPLSLRLAVRVRDIRRYLDKHPTLKFCLQASAFFLAIFAFSWLVMAL